MSNIQIVHQYAHSPANVWRALTDPHTIPLWTSAGPRVGLPPAPGDATLVRASNGSSRLLDLAKRQSSNVRR